MSGSELQVGARRTMPVTATGELTPTTSARRLWACEQFDGLLWQLVGMACTEHECQAFLSGR